MANAHWWKALQPNLPYATWHAEVAEMEAMLSWTATWRTVEEGRVCRLFRTHRFGRGWERLSWHVREAYTPDTWQNRN